VRICHVITTAELGGAQLSTFRLILELSKTQGHEITLIYGEEGFLSDKYKELERYNVKVIRFKALKRRFNIFADFKAYQEIKKFLKESNFDIVHTHSSKPSIIARLAAIKSKIKTIHTYHGFGHDYFKNLLIRFIFIFIEGIINRLSSALIFVCRENFDRAGKVKILNRKNNLIIPDNIDFEEIKTIKVTKNIKKVIGSILSFKEQKTPFDIIKIMKGLSGKFDNLQFQLAGDGQLLSECRKFAEKIDVDIKFMGNIHKIGEFYKNLDLFIGASRFEGLSMAQIECLILKIPMVITNAGGIKDFFEDGKQGFFYKYGDIEKAQEFCKQIIDGEFNYIPMDERKFEDFKTQNIIKRIDGIYKTI